MKITSLLCGILLFAFSASAQKYPERRIAREGNRLFEKGDLQGAAARYDEALKLREEFTEARFNLGNAMLAGEKIDEAIELYKAVLRSRPDDRDAKYNLAYAQKLKQQKDEQEQKQDGKQPQEQPSQSQGQEQSQPQEQSGEQPPQGQPQMSQAEAEAMLRAMQAEEDKTKQEMEGEKVPAGSRSGKNW